jgi:hypothetical protein
MTSTRRGTLGIAASAAILAGLISPLAASANVYCVGTSGGDCTNLSADFQTALNDADTNAGNDTVRLGPVTFTGPQLTGFDYVAGNGNVSIIGAGQGQTTLTMPADPGSAFTINEVLHLDGSGGGSSVSDLTIALPTPSNNDMFGSQYRGVVLFQGHATRVSVTAPAIQVNGYGFWAMSAASPTTIEDSSVSFPLGMNAGQTGVIGDGSITVEDSSINADRGFLLRTAGLTHAIRRTIVRARFYGITLDRGTLNLASTLINLGSFDGFGVRSEGNDGSADSATLNLDHATFVGTNPSFDGVAVIADDPMAADTMTATITNSVISGPAVPITRSAGNTDTANVSTDYSNYNAAGNVSSNTGGGMGAITAAHTTNLAPGFVNPALGDYHLASTSPLIDTGDPAPAGMGELDLDGHPRGLDGTPPCFPPAAGIRDIGADEFVCAAPQGAVTPDAAPDTTAAGKDRIKTRKKRVRVMIALGASEAGVRFACSIDGGPFLACSNPFLTPKLRRGAHEVLVRATDALGNADPTPAAFEFRILRKRR